MAGNSYQAYEAMKKKYKLNTGVYDDALAKNNPDAGVGLLNYKLSYQNAKSDAERRAANEGANTIRAQYGGYSGGADGSYYLPLTSFFGSNGAVDGSSIFGDGSYGVVSEDLPGGRYGYLDWQESRIDETPADFDFGPYVSPYETRIGDYVSALDRESRPWSYDVNADQAYQAARKQYLREADRASADTLAQYAAMTGGMPSSAAISAASEASADHLARLNASLGSYIDADYRRYLDRESAGREGNAENLALLADLDRESFDRYRDQRDFAYARFGDDLSHRLAEEDKERSGRQSICRGRWNNLQDMASRYYDNAARAAERIYDNQNAEDDRAYQRQWSREERDYERQLDRWQQQQTVTQQRDALIMDQYSALMQQYELTLDPSYRRQALSLLAQLSVNKG